MDWLSLLNNFAFPVVACIFLGWLCYNQNKTLNDFSSTLKDVSKTLTELNVRIESIEDKLEK